MKPKLKGTISEKRRFKLLQIK